MEYKVNQRFIDRRNGYTVKIIDIIRCHPFDENQWMYQIIYEQPGYRASFSKRDLDCYCNIIADNCVGVKNPGNLSAEKQGWKGQDYKSNIKTRNMNIKEKFALALTKEPMKSFRKVGITNGDNLLTDDGMKIFLSWLLDSKYAEEFKKEVVDDMLKDAKEDEK